MPDRGYNRDCAERAERRVQAVLECIDVLLPGINASRKKRIARQILSLCDGKDRGTRIGPGATQQIVLRHLQCIARNCPLLIFAEPLSRELNQFFEEE
jgi:hypothetical protein